MGEHRSGVAVIEVPADELTAVANITDRANLFGRVEVERKLLVSRRLGGRSSTGAESTVVVAAEEPLRCWRRARSLLLRSSPTGLLALLASAWALEVW
jgi:hypothetical protein